MLFLCLFLRLVKPFHLISLSVREKQHLWLQLFTLHSFIPKVTSLLKALFASCEVFIFTSRVCHNLCMLFPSYSIMQKASSPEGTGYVWPWELYQSQAFNCIKKRARQGKVPALAFHISNSLNQRELFESFMLDYFLVQILLGSFWKFCLRCLL